MPSSPVENLEGYDCVLIVADHSHYDYAKIVAELQLVVDTRTAKKDIQSSKIVRC
jgi:UDP-N-acetyl-D-glucosamine dehydrogenase